ncbi:unnamed protein product [Meloidogyne enterolobii]|uniref:Uncharacterized protein n=1 Tax=Meloidogyne enterolobii TaxID=390850 RepID=A0ACB0ZH40_MELEN
MPRSLFFTQKAHFIQNQTDIYPNHNITLLKIPSSILFIPFQIPRSSFLSPDINLCPLKPMISPLS